MSEQMASNGAPEVALRAEIERLRDEWETANRLKNEYRREVERLRGGLDAAVRAANLAIFVIRKQGVMPNSSWQAGFERDLATATAALANEQPEAVPTKEG